MTVNEVRQKYLDFCQRHGHTIIPSASLVPENDPTTLFTGSGMQPLVPFLLGENHPMGDRLANSQRCFRAEDIEEVGDNRHTTFFEMLGNWSLGSYFKEEQLRFFFTFLVDEIGLNPEKLYVTVFSGDSDAGIEKDKESLRLWKELFEEKGIEANVVDLETEENGGRLGMQGGRIFSYGSKKNWWSRSGVPDQMPEGEPGGPDSEVFYEFSDVEHDEKFGKHCHPNCDCGRFMEIGNSVFMEFVRVQDGFDTLPQKNVDFGGGLERIVASTLDTPDVFEVSALRGIIENIEQMTGLSYKDISPQKQRTFRIVADHIRGSVFMIGDGVLPSNTAQGYLLRRLIRRAIRFADGVGIPRKKLASLVDPVISYYGGFYEHLLVEARQIQKVIQDEEEKFRTTLERGMKEFEKFVKQGGLDGNKAFVLFSTYGFPLEMTVELARERGLNVDEEQYRAEFEKHKELSRTASSGVFKGGLANSSKKTTALHTSTHLMLAGLRKYLGDHVHQAGSNITEERTRFDFTHPEKVDRETLDKVEAYVNEALSKGCFVSIEKMPKEKAKETGVEGSFWEKYPDEVNVYSIKDAKGNIYSRELCGGPHVENTGAIQGVFRITKEQSSSAGVRRVKAILE
jgi:alanyl-tRNA synthetase